ncbi:MAG TPA: hypothetical protein VMW30_07645 [Candidatus Paceibacterota bacterium]|nr:hypothetical protein [Candidatus Paceibacterota bacterium]
MARTWDEYLAEMTNYVLAIRQAAQVGSDFPAEPPTRPTDPIPDDYRDQARRLRDACDQVAVEVSARMRVIANRPPSARQSPHQADRLASYLETDM